MSPGNPDQKVYVYAVFSSLTFSPIFGLSIVSMARARAFATLLRKHRLLFSFLLMSVSITTLQCPAQHLMTRLKALDSAAPGHKGALEISKKDIGSAVLDNPGLHTRFFLHGPEPRMCQAAGHWLVFSFTTPLWKPLMSTLLTSTSVLGSSSVRGFELEWSLMAPSLEGFSLTGHEKRVPGPPFKGIKRVRGAQSGHFESGL